MKPSLLRSFIVALLSSLVVLFGSVFLEQSRQAVAAPTGMSITNTVLTANGTIQTKGLPLIRNTATVTGDWHIFLPSLFKQVVPSCNDNESVNNNFTTAPLLALALPPLFWCEGNLNNHVAGQTAPESDYYALSVPMTQTAVITLFNATIYYDTGVLDVALLDADGNVLFDTTQLSVKRFAATLSPNTTYVIRVYSTPPPAPYAPYHLAVALPAPPILLPLCGDVENSNNAISTAPSIQVQGSPCQGNLNGSSGQKESDFYRLPDFTVAAIISLTLTGIPPNAAYNVALRSLTTGEILQDSKGLDANNKVVCTTLRPGSYVIEVYTDQATAEDAPYQLTVSSTASPACNDVEPNNIPADASSLGTLPIVCKGSLESDPEGEDDYYRLSLAANQLVLIELLGIPQGADYDISLLDTPTHVITSSARSTTTNEILPYLVPVSHDYILRINQYRKSSLAPNDYYLRVTILTPACNDVEPNDISRQASPLTTIGTECVGTMEDATDEPNLEDDYYKFTLQSGQSIDIQLSQLPSGADYDLTLLGPNAFRLDSASTGNADERITTSITSAGEYTLRINLYHKSVANLNTYHLKVNVPASQALGAQEQPTPSSLTLRRLVQLTP